MGEIDAIKNRHSVRNYEDKKIEADKVAKLEDLISACNREGNLHLQFLQDAGKTFGKLLNKAMGLSSAPSAIACVGPNDDTLEERIGYYGERVVLAAQEMGLNTCWAGTFNAKNIAADIRQGERLVIVIAIGHGQNSGKPHKSKSMKDVIAAKGDKPYWFNFGVEMALLAPTAVNQQKFEIALNEDGTVTFTDKGGIFSKVDLGIVKYHFEVGMNFVKQQSERGKEDGGDADRADDKTSRADGDRASGKANHVTEEGNASKAGDTGFGKEGVDADGASGKASGTSEVGDTGKENHASEELGRWR